jgi:hypothetical protein
MVGHVLGSLRQPHQPPDVGRVLPADCVGGN